MRKLLAATKAFGEPTRVRAIMALRGGELCVCELCDALELAQSTLSTHLQYLRQAELVETRNDGKWVYYALTAEFAQVVDALVKLHREDLSADPLLKKDAARLKKRLSKREGDACCLGFPSKQTRAPRPRKASKADCQP